MGTKTKKKCTFVVFMCYFLYFCSFSLYIIVTIIPKSSFFVFFPLNIHPYLCPKNTNICPIH